MTSRCIPAAVLLAAALYAVPPAGYHLLKSISVPGEGGWDYLTVDESGRRLYVSHGTQVEVLDIDHGSIVGRIPNTQGVHGIAIAAELGRGFTSNGRTSTITIFDLKSLHPIEEVKSTGENPDAIIYDPASRRVFAFNGRSGSATAIDARSGKVAGSMELGGKPEFAAADGAGQVFVNLEDKSMVVKLDSRKLAVEQKWPLAPCEEPSAMAIDRKNHRLFIGCGNKLMAVVNADSGRVITTLPIGDHVDAAAFDPQTGLAFASNGDGTLTVIHQDSPDRYSVVENAKTQAGARTMALDPKTHDVFLSVAEYGPAPAPTAAQPKPKRPLVPGSFKILVMGR
jgi:DNA-binding beta-propeller fold protein YncE